ncbi:hypothetical protein BJX99DRAFT_263333 [Aspergillus californicus]
MSENISTLHPNPDEPTVHGPLWQHGTAAGACRCSIDEPRLRKIDPNPKNPDDIVPDNAPTRGSEPRADISSLQREFRPSQLMPSSVIGRSPASLNTTLPVREKKKSNLPCSSGPPRASPSIKPKRNVLFHDGDQTTDQTTELLLEDQLATNQDEWEVKHSVPLVEGESFEQGKASEGNKSFEDHKASGERKYEENADKEFEKEKPKGGSDFEGSTEFDVKAKVHENKGKAISRYPLGPDPGPSNSHKHAQLESRGQIADQKKHYYVEPSSIKSDTASLNNSSAALITNKGISNPKHDVTPLHEFFRKEIHRGLNLKHEVSPQREIRSAHEVTPMRAISLIHGASHVIEKVDGAENISKGDERIDEDKHIGSSPSCYDLNSDASVLQRQGTTREARGIKPEDLRSIPIDSFTKLGPDDSGKDHRETEHRPEVTVQQVLGPKPQNTTEVASTKEENEPDIDSQHRDQKLQTGSVQNNQLSLEPIAKLLRQRPYLMTFALCQALFVIVPLVIFVIGLLGNAFITTGAYTVIMGLLMGPVIVGMSIIGLGLWCFLVGFYQIMRILFALSPLELTFESRVC